MKPRPILSVVITRARARDDLGATVQSLTQQTDVACETLVVDDAADRVAALQRAIDAGQAPFITLVRAGDVLRPGALRELCDALAEWPQAGLVYALSLPLDAGDPISREEAHSRANRLRARVSPRSPPGPDILGALPTFRREALAACGRLTGTSQHAAVWAAVRQVAARGEARLVSRILCATPGRDGGRPWRARLAGRMRRWRPWARHAVARFARAAHAAPVSGRLLRAPRPYALFGAVLRRWSCEGLRLPARRRSPAGEERIAYTLRRYPMLSETFIRREVQALRQSGISLEVLALEPADPPLAIDPNSPAGPVAYFGPADEAAGRTIILAHLKRQPWTVIRLWCFIVRHRSLIDTTWWRDRDVLFLAGQLSSALTTRGITHVHAPWADHFSLVAFVAARLSGVTFSVQARASEIHRTAQAPLVADRLRFAEFVITNSRYNERDLRARRAGAGAPPIHVVYNGVDLSRFRPAAVERMAGPFRLLSVGRLVEPKGLRYLLHACRLLRDRGIDLSCDIIGAPVEPSDTVTWLELRMLLTELDLGTTVRFLGRQPFSTVLAAFERTDLFVLPCVRGSDGSHDITPNALIEAMAMGLPVISTTSGAIPEIVDHGTDGWLVPPNDAAALADAVKRLVGDADLRQALGAAARRKVEDRFDIDRNVTRRVALFRGLRNLPT